MTSASPARPDLVGDVGMVASTHWLATASAMSVLERGGNAFDAACAGGFVLQIVEPHLNGPGGEVPIVLWSADDGVPQVVCGQGVSPQGATIETFAGLGLDLVPGTGLLAATVPGAFGAWTLLLERWGTWELADVLEYAIGYAERGFPVLPRISGQIDAVAEMFRTEWAPSATTWLVDGAAPAAGTVHRLPVLATTLRTVLARAAGATTRETRIAAARDQWYRGWVAEAVDRFCRTTRWRDTSGRRHGGLLDGGDLAGWQATVEPTLQHDYGDLTVHKTGPWGQGPVLLQQLALLDGLDLDGAGHLSAEWIHLVTEASKLAFADREAWYADPAVMEPPVEALLDAAYTRRRRALIGDRASRELRPGSPAGRTPRLPVTRVADEGAALGTGEPTVSPTGAVRGDTCHIDVVDRDGNMVSATPSGGWLQSSPTIPELGFCLGTRLQMAWPEPGLAGSLRPRTRPRTTLSPTLVLRDGEPWIAMGTPGGDQQDQWQLELLLTLAHTDLSFQAAIEAPTFHNLHAPSSFYPRDAHPGEVVVEDRLDPGTVAALRARGHDIVLAPAWSLGRMTLVSRSGGRLHAAADPRGAQAYAAGR